MGADDACESGGCQTVDTNVSGNPHLTLVLSLILVNEMGPIIL